MLIFLYHPILNAYLPVSSNFKCTSSCIIHIPNIILNIRPQDLKQLSYKYKRSVYFTYEGVKTIIEASQSKPVVENRDKILDLLKEAHASATSATHVATPGVSGKKRAASPGPAAAQLDDQANGYKEGESATQHIQKIHRNASDCAQQLERVVGYNGAVVTGTKDVVEYARAAEACSMQLQRVNTEAQSMVRHVHESMQELDSFAAKYADQRDLLRQCSNDMKEYTTTMKECAVDLETLGTAVVKVGQAFATLTANHAAYLDVKREESAIDSSKMDKRLDFETRITVFEDAKVKRLSDTESIKLKSLSDTEDVKLKSLSEMEDVKLKSAKAMLEIEKERAELQLRMANLKAQTANNKNNTAKETDEDPTLTTFTINELCKKHKLLEGIDTCHYFEIFKRAGELSAIEHKAKEWDFAERRDGKSNAYPMKYEAAKLAICKHTIAQFKAKQLAKMRRQAAGEGQQSLDAFWRRQDEDGLNE